MFMIARRQPPVKQKPQSFLHCRKIAENRRKTQKRCKLNLQIRCGLELPQSKPDGFASSLWEGASGAPANFALQPGTVPPCQGPHPRGGCRAQRDWGSSAACALSVTCGDTSPKGRGKSTAGNFLIVPNTLATNLTAWLSLRGKTSPAPGEDVTVGDKKGNLARERLRGRAGLTGHSLKKYAKNSAFRRVL